MKNCEWLGKMGIKNFRYQNTIVQWLTILQKNKNKNNKTYRNEWNQAVDIKSDKWNQYGETLMTYAKKAHS